MLSAKQSASSTGSILSSIEFLAGVRKLKYHAITGVRCDRKLADGRSMAQLHKRGQQVRLVGLNFPVSLSWYYCTSRQWSARKTVCFIYQLMLGQVIVIDNATFHKGGRIEQLIHDTGCELLSLPPYSPDLNKIEKCWFWLHLSNPQKTWAVRFFTRCYRGCVRFIILTTLTIAIYR